MCVHFFKGRCRNGNNCSYAHDEGELQYRPDWQKTKLCQRFVRYGKCDRDPKDCCFAHGWAELRATKDVFKTQLCSFYKRDGGCNLGDRCRYAHGFIEMTNEIGVPKPPKRDCLVTGSDISTDDLLADRKPPLLDTPKDHLIGVPPVAVPSAPAAAAEPSIPKTDSSWFQSRSNLDAQTKKSSDCGFDPKIRLSTDQRNPAGLLSNGSSIGSPSSVADEPESLTQIVGNIFYWIAKMHTKKPLTDDYLMTQSVLLLLTWMITFSKTSVDTDGMKDFLAKLFSDNPAVAVDNLHSLLTYFNSSSVKESIFSSTSHSPIQKVEDILAPLFNGNSDFQTLENRPLEEYEGQLLDKPTLKKCISSPDFKSEALPTKVTEFLFQKVQKKRLSGLPKQGALSNAFQSCPEFKAIQCIFDELDDSVLSDSRSEESSLFEHDPCSPLAPLRSVWSSSGDLSMMKNRQEDFKVYPALSHVAKRINKNKSTC